MERTKRWQVVLLLALLVLAVTGCSQTKNQAVQVLTEYMTYLGNGEYGKAYALISDFDNGNLAEEDFIRWQELAAQIARTDSFSVDSKVDTFKDYKYLGTQFGLVHGLKVDRKQAMLIPEAELAGYDKATFRIMVQMKGDTGRVLLLVTSLDETIAAYEAYVSKEP